jgi:hypothetical protein
MGGDFEGGDFEGAQLLDLAYLDDDNRRGDIELIEEFILDKLLREMLPMEESKVWRIAEKKEFSPSPSFKLSSV